MENQAKNQEQETHGKTTNHINNKDKKQTNTTKILSPKADVLTKLDYGRSYLQ
jgi:hypothetical protein